MADDLRKRVLVVDDSSFQLARIREILEESDHEVLECTSAQDAIDVLSRERHDLDLVITDLEMPNMNGFELLKWLKNQSFGLDISTLVLTGAYDLTEVVEEMRKLGVNAVLEKGGHPHHILSRVNSILFPEIVEKRKFDRISVHFPVVYEMKNVHYDALITNISLGGCFILTKELARPDELVTVLMTLPSQDRKLKISGAVTWVIGGEEWQGRRRKVEGMGLKWTGLPDADKIALEVYIEEKFKEERLYSLLSP